MNKVYFTKIKSVRRSLNKSVKEVAEYLEVYEDTYRNKENGKNEFTVSEAKKLMELFDKKFEDLF